MENKDLCRDAPVDQFCIFMDLKSFLGWKLVLYHISAFWDFRISCCLVVFLQPPGGALSQLSGTAVAAEPTGQGRVLRSECLRSERLLRTFRTTDHCETSLRHRGGRRQCASQVKEVKKVLESGDLVLAARCLSPGEAAPPLVWRADHAVLHPCIFVCFV